MAVQPPWIGPLLLLFTAREAVPTHLAQSPSLFLSSKSGFSPVTIPLGPRFRATAPVSRRRPVRQIRGRCSPEGRPEKSQEENCEDPGPEKEMMVHKVGDVLEGRKYNYTIVRVLPPSIDGTDMYEAAYATDLGAQIVTIRALRLSKLRTWGQLDQLEEEATSMMTPSGKLRSARMVEKFEVTRGEDTKWYLIQEPIDQLPLESEQAKSQPKRAMKAVGITRGRMTIISRGGGLFARIEPQGMERGIGTKTAFAVAWNVFVFVWTRGSLMAGGPLFAAFSLPFWASGLRMGRETVRSIYRSLVTTEIEVIDGYLKLSKSLSLPQRKRRRIRRNEEGDERFMQRRIARLRSLARKEIKIDVRDVEIGDIVEISQDPYEEELGLELLAEDDDGDVNAELIGEGLSEEQLARLREALVEYVKHGKTWHEVRSRSGVWP